MTPIPDYGRLLAMEPPPFSAAIAAALKMPTGATLEQIVEYVKRVQGTSPPTQQVSDLAAALLIALEDVRRINRLDAEAWNPVRGNGIAEFPSTGISGEMIVLQDLGDEDGSNLGDEIARGSDLRAAIDNLDVKE